MTKGEKGGKPGVRHYKKMLSVEDVKKRTKCRRCLQKGHWARDCPSTQSFEANFSWSGHLLYLFLFSLYLLCLYLYYLISFFQVTWSRIISASAARSTTPSTTSWLTKVRWSESLIEIYEGCVLVDTAAGHPTCGGSYFDALERGLNKHGIKSVIIIQCGVHTHESQGRGRYCPDQGSKFDPHESRECHDVCGAFGIEK